MKSRYVIKVGNNYYNDKNDYSSDLNTATVYPDIYAAHFKLMQLIEKHTQVINVIELETKKVIIKIQGE